nr:hypothetical protein [Tanacetum cinerariifolium]
MGIRHALPLINYPNGKPYLPPACYTMSHVEKYSFLQLLKYLKVPDGYSSNISKGGLCAKVLDPGELDKIEYQLVQTLCELEQISLPSFFTVMVHSTIHLIYEVKLGGTVHYIWMYSIERYLMQLKSYVRNKTQLEGPIAEGYIKEECLNFCSRYFKGVETPFNHPLRNDENVFEKEMYMFNSSGRKLGKVEILELDGKCLAQAHRYVLLNHSKIQPQKFNIPQGEKVDKVLSTMLSAKRKTVKYRLKKGLYQQATNKLNEANGINGLDAQEKKYTDDELLAALVLVPMNGSLTP